VSVFSQECCAFCGLRFPTPCDRSKHKREINEFHFHDMAAVATPKQIRELMKVDGLTNDEVKSHLQVSAVHHKQSSFSPVSRTFTQLILLL
jgi:SHAQKYF class myb-like DNA-binding protein